MSELIKGKIDVLKGDRIILKAQEIKTRRFEVEEVAKLYNVPSRILKELPESNFKYIEEMKKTAYEILFKKWSEKGE